MLFKSITSSCNNHVAWQNSLLFYKNEFKILEGRLHEIASKNNGHEVMEGVEHFQNQFIIQKNNIDELNHSIHLHDEHVAAEAKIHAGKISNSLHIEHDHLDEQVTRLERIINEVRHEFNLFLAKWM
jgi:hypothetical protein